MELGGTRVKYIQLVVCTKLQIMDPIIPSHPTPASSEWRQLWVRIGLLEHSSSWLEVVLH